MASCCCSKKAKNELVVEESRNWDDLPKEITANILKRLDTTDLVMGAMPVCSTWFNICKDPSMWRILDMRSNPRLDYNNPPAAASLRKISRIAVDRSCGQMEEVNIEKFANNNLLYYIAHRASNLRRIRLARCFNVSDKAVQRIVKILPLLEEVDISHVLTKTALQVIGQSCPSLTSLKFSTLFNTWYKRDDDAIVIANTMPNLRQLKMIGNAVTNDGLCAILDKCPLLESLDLRYCLHLENLTTGTLGETLRTRIKYLRLPPDYRSDDSCGPEIDDRGTYIIRIA